MPTSKIMEDDPKQNGKWKTTSPKKIKMEDDLIPKISFLVAWKYLKSCAGVGSYPLLSQAPTPVEVELGCDKNLTDIQTC
jgi:hypothetical protein